MATTPIPDPDDPPIGPNNPVPGPNDPPTDIPPSEKPEQPAPPLDV